MKWRRIRGEKTKEYTAWKEEAQKDLQSKHASGTQTEAQVWWQVNHGGGADLSLGAISLGASSLFCYDNHLHLVLLDGELQVILLIHPRHLHLGVKSSFILVQAGNHLWKKQNWG